MKQSIHMTLCWLMLAAALPAQHAHTTSPYAGQSESDIPSLTSEELEGLRHGDGLGLAKPAELNHYPGPKHVLELTEQLDLSEEQRQRVEAIRAAMLSDAVRVGELIIEKERMLNRRFRHEHIDDKALQDLTAEIALLRGELRYAHLAAHLTTRAVLTPEQVTEYDRLRGYGAGTHEH